MDTLLPSGNIFRELQDIHDTGYFSAQPSLEDHWQQVRRPRACSANFSWINFASRRSNFQCRRHCAYRLSPCRYSIVKPMTRNILRGTLMAVS
ncbi:Krueppel-like factor [Ooceraea biroi]|uniref:Krueppel-like factor n=1 Tax=Ooceraea biroi TaxID=2015173 RepID=A0A026WXP3_OOCBI|nr:Krueppel-like factor [Ooceraea biroi]